MTLYYIWGMSTPNFQITTHPELSARIQKGRIDNAPCIPDANVFNYAIWNLARFLARFDSLVSGITYRIYRTYGTDSE